MKIKLSSNLIYIFQFLGIVYSGNVKFHVNVMLFQVWKRTTQRRRLVNCQPVSSSVATVGDGLRMCQIIASATDDHEPLHTQTFVMHLSLSRVIDIHRLGHVESINSNRKHCSLKRRYCRSVMFWQNKLMYL